MPAISLRPENPAPNAVRRSIREDGGEPSTPNATVRASVSSEWARADARLGANGRPFTEWQVCWWAGAVSRGR